LGLDLHLDLHFHLDLDLHVDFHLHVQLDACLYARLQRADHDHHRRCLGRHHLP
jgi:hypothetical protein